MPRRFLSCVLAAAIPAAAVAQQSFLPLATAVVESKDGSQLSISGSGFGSGTPTVTLAGAPLAVLSASDTTIVAALPANTIAGSYLLTILNAKTRLLGAFTATLAPEQGAVGPAGPAGPQGAPGPAGPPGLAGAPGPAGLKGATGAAGIAGAAGPIGSQGAAGAAGATGAAGLTGPAGSSGAQGPAGLAGAQGPVGLQGVRGAAGAIGLPGPIGPAGTTGQQGVQGAVGAMGLQGPTGPPGAAGASGPAGSPVTFFSTNLVVGTSTSEFGQTLGNGTAVTDSTGTPPNSVLSGQLCPYPTSFQVTAFGARGTSTLQVHLLTYDVYDSTNNYYFIPSCTLQASNGAPVSCTSNSPRLSTPAAGPSLIYMTSPSIADWTGSHVLVSAVCSQ